MEVPLFVLALVVVLALVYFFVRFFLRHGDQPADHPYKLCDGLLSPAEADFFNVLVPAAGPTVRVFAKVRVADVINPHKGLKRGEWFSAFNAISAKHFDFVLCRPDDYSFVLAVELDDSSHGTARVKKRDALINRACRSADLSLLRAKAASSYSGVHLQRLINDAIAGKSTAGSASNIEADASRDPAVAENVLSESSSTTGVCFKPGENGSVPSVPSVSSVSKVDVANSSAGTGCPRCGSLMVRRVGKSGANAGRKFLGCSRYPRCRGTVLD